MCLRDKSGGLVYVSYDGVVEMTPELGLVFGGSPDAKTTDFGKSCKCLCSLSSSAEFVPLPISAPWCCVCSFFPLGVESDRCRSH